MRTLPVARLNRWPRGSQRIPCLGCGKTVLSRSKAERLCATCRKAANELDQTAHRVTGLRPLGG